MSEMLITITQALQLVALAPSIFVITFLIATAKRDGKNIIAILYFLSLASGFVLNLLPIFGEADTMVLQRGILSIMSYSLPAMSFLLVLQFIRGRIPRMFYWFILSVPLIGGVPLVYNTLIANEACFNAGYCMMTSDVRSLYFGITSAGIFLFLTVVFFRSHSALAANELDYKHRYWMVISILMLNLMVLGVDLAQLNKSITDQNALLITTVMRIGFIYVVLTSIFRLFYDIFDVTISGNGERVVRNPEQDKRWVDELQAMLSKGIYREMSLSREVVGKKLGISEQQVSRIVNTYFGKNFNELVNEKRVAEAKERLKTEDTQITTIAFEVGFSSIASFNRVFKEATGSSPTAFRSFHKNSPK